MKILLIDDEPFFIEELITIIEDFSNIKQTEIFEIKSVYNAEDALKIIPIMMPDYIFTDIKMATMNGVELSKVIYEQWPNIKIVIISGYPSFDYAKEAIKANVVDFLTKPVYDTEVHTLLSQFLDESDKKVHKKIEGQLRYFLSTKEINLKLNEEINLINCRYRYFYGILVKNFEGIYSDELFFPRPPEKLYIKKINDLLCDDEDIWLLNNSIQGDVIIILGMNKADNNKVNLILTETSEEFSDNKAFASIAHGKIYESITRLLEELPLMRRKLYAALKIEKQQVIDVTKPLNESNNSNHLISNFIENKLQTLIINCKWIDLRNEIASLFSYWQEEDLTCMVIEQNIKKIARIFLENSSINGSIVISILEKRIEEIVYSSDTFKELEEALWQVLSEYFLTDLANENQDSKKVFYKIKDYLQRNLHEPITLTFLTETFYISKTQLSNLFQKEINQSFVEYLTYLRVEKAKEMMIEQPDWLLKDIAQIVGYTDPYYFSRIFKQYEGVSPTDFRERFRIDR